MIGLGMYGRMKQGQEQGDKQQPKGGPGKSTNEPKRHGQEHGPPESQPGEPVRAGAWEADADTMSAFGMDAEQTGVGVVDEGFGCEDPKTQPEGECFLTDAQRGLMYTALSTVVGSAMDSYRDAIQNVRLDKMLEQDESAWGFLAEFLFYSLTGPLIGSALKGFKRAKEGAKVIKMARDWGIKLSDSTPTTMTTFQALISKVSDENASATLQNVSRGLRTELKNAAHAGSSSGKAWDVFLRIIQDHIKPLTDSIVLDGPAGMSDAELCVFVEGYRDEKVHNVPAYEGMVSSLLSRFEKQRIADINEPLDDGGKYKPIMLEAYGTRRMGILADHKQGRIRTDHVGEGRGEQVVGDGTDYLVSFVDDDLAPLAEQLFGGSVKKVHVTEESYPFSFSKNPGGQGGVNIIKSEAVEPQFKAWVSEAKKTAERVEAGTDAAREARNAIGEVF